MFDESLKCAICMDLCVRPVTVRAERMMEKKKRLSFSFNLDLSLFLIDLNSSSSFALSLSPSPLLPLPPPLPNNSQAPCQHNFCLGCFTKWTQQGKRSCPTCRSAFPNRFAENARVNTALVLAIRVAKASSGNGSGKPRASGPLAPPKPQIRLIDRERPLGAVVTERAQRSGRANAASGRILVTIPADWFGPIPAAHCPEPPHSGERGVEVGDTWADRLDCRQYGAHFPHVAGIAGQSHCGAQSVVLSVKKEKEGEESFFLFLSR